MLTRAMLKGMSLTDEQVGAIIEGHSETVDALKAEIQQANEKVASVQKDLELARAQASEPNEYEQKYAELQKKYDEREKEYAAEAEKALKEKEFKNILRELNINEQISDLILKSADLSVLEVEDGKLTNKEAVSEKLKADYASYIPKVETHGADVSEHSRTNSGSGITKEQFDKMNYSDRAKLYQTDPETYKELSNS